MNTDKNNDLPVLVWGVVVLLVAGMLLISAVTVLVADSTATVAAIGGLLTTGVAGIFGLSKLKEGQIKATEKIDENTRLTQNVAHSLNGELDARMKRVAKEAMEEVLNEWTKPRA